MRLGILTLLSTAILLPVAVFAQSLGTLVSTDPFTISVAPRYPAPGSVATLSFLSGSIDLTNATLSVAAGAKNIYAGAVRPVSLTLGKAGSVITIVATVSIGKTNYRQTLKLAPQDVALIAEPISSAPVLYPGKSRVPLEGNTRLVAMANVRGANGVPQNPATLSYVWTVDDTEIANSSGIGKSAIIVASPLQFRARTVSVTVKSPDGTLIGGDALSLDPLEPTVRIYENDPLLGIRFDRALSGLYTIPGAEATLYGAPFSFPTTIGTPRLEWFLNGARAQTGNSITLKPTGTGQGNATLSLTASSGTNSTATANLPLFFGAAPSTNIFGL